MNHKISYQPVAASFLAGKVLLGKPLKDAEFQFELLDEKGTVLETVSNDTLGKIQFSPLTFETPGNYQYTIREVNTQQTGVSYDTHNLQVQVTVEALLGNLVATTQYDGGQVFTNHYARKTYRKYHTTNEWDNRYYHEFNHRNYFNNH